MKNDNTISKTAFKRRAFNRMRQNEEPLSAADKTKLKYLQQTENYGIPAELDRITGGIRGKRKV